MKTKLQQPVFVAQDVKNCRRFLKRCYTLMQPIDDALITHLEVFGFVEYASFKEFSPNAYDFFKIKLDDCIQIDGVMNGVDMYVTLSKSSLSIFDDVEAIITKWHEQSNR